MALHLKLSSTYGVGLLSERRVRGNLFQAKGFFFLSLALRSDQERGVSVGRSVGRLAGRSSLSQSTAATATATSATAREKEFGTDFQQAKKQTVCASSLLLHSLSIELR